MILVNIYWYIIQITTVVQINIQSCVVDKEDPNFGVEVCLIEATKFNLRRRRWLNLLSNLFIVVSNPVVISIPSKHRVKLWYPNILQVEEYETHIVDVAVNHIINLNSVNKDTLFLRIISWVKREWINRNRSVDKREWIVELEFHNNRLCGTRIVWEAVANTLTDKQELHWEVEIDNTMHLSISVDTHAINVFESWVIFFTLTVGENSAVVSVNFEHIVTRW